MRNTSLKDEIKKLHTKHGIMLNTIHAGFAVSTTRSWCVEDKHAHIEENTIEPYRILNGMGC